MADRLTNRRTALRAGSLIDRLSYNTQLNALGCMQTILEAARRDQVQTASIEYAVVNLRALRHEYKRVLRR